MQYLIIKILLGMLKTTLIPLLTTFLEKKLKQLDIDKL
jgi:hypothetical protein